jgi:membrane dipeptidase
MFPPFLKNGASSTLADYIEAIDYVVNVVGEDHVGIGTDFTEDYDDEFFRWITHDKGNARELTRFGQILNPEGIRRLRDYPNLTRAMVRAGWSSGKIEKILGRNWLALLSEVWK